jgi:hypothetical protein
MMPNPYLDTEELPLTRVVGGQVDLIKLIEELDQMYPDVYPEYTLPEKTLAFQAGAISIIRYLKGKTQSCA